MTESFISVANTLLADAKSNDYAGYDPFDGLNSKVFRGSGLHRFAFARLAWIQLFKRSPINLRGLTAVPKLRNPKGVALFILGMLEDYARTGNRELFDEAKRLGDWLLTQRCDSAEWPHHAWGYHFDWQARAFYVPVGKPNVITTWYVAKALLALTAAGGDENYREAALDAAVFVVDALYTESDGYRYFSYIPGERAFVHNASLWASALVVLAGHAWGNQDMIALGRSVARQSIAMQRPDGSWPYGTMAHHLFIDGFHTGYNIEALDLISRTLGETEFAEPIARGLRYYREKFFEEDGTAKYYNSNRYPLDMHSVAQAVVTFLRVGDHGADAGLARHVMAWAIDNMYIPSKRRFYYQRLCYWDNSINYSRWTQAWSYYALAVLNRETSY